MSSFYRQQLENYLSGIEINTDSLLDIGGTEKSIIKRLKNCNTKRYAILDHEKIDNDKIEFYQADLNYYQSAESLFNNHRWQTTFCLEVFEYIWNPIIAIMNIYDWLETGGAAYISFPFIYPQHEPVGIDYLRYTESGIRKLLSEPFGKGFSEFEIVARTATEGKANLVNFFNQEKMHAAKNKHHDVIGFIAHCVK